jgi:MbtH protein
MFEHCKVWKVVISREDQYSVWPAYKDIPAGWRDAGKEGEKEECLNYIKEVWVDMRPRSLRELMDMKKIEASEAIIPEVNQDTLNKKQPKKRLA